MGSPEYSETINLRNKVLSESAGKPNIKGFLSDEQKDIHLAIKREECIVGTLLLHPCSKIVSK